jgi:hypothetical protein
MKNKMMMMKAAAKGKTPKSAGKKNPFAAMRAKAKPAPKK